MMLRRLLVVASLALLGAMLTPNAPARAQRQPAAAPTYRIFATREGLVGHRTANGHIIRPRDRFVALPSPTVLSSKGGDEFRVRVTYKGRSAVLPVWDVGPWNTRDDYWSSKRRYSDLPVGVPMAQAAYESGYNRGRDEFGRRVGLPNGIDIADGAFWDDLGMTNSDWVEVTFLWLGEDPGGQATPAEQPAQPTQPPRNEDTPLEQGATQIDNGAEGYRAADARWDSDACGQGGRAAWTYSTRDPARSTHRARWSATLGWSGFFEAMAYIPNCGRAATSTARYRVSHGDSVSEVTVDQRAAAGKWVSLGVFLAQGGSVAVELSDLTAENGRAVFFDAVKWVPRTDTGPPEARVRTAAARPDGSLLVHWSGTDDVSGIAAYDVQVRRLPDAGWTDWLIDTIDLEASFVPPGPGTYAFRARARDWLGHEQPWRDADDLTAMVP
ncbi:MAG TPA: hypothetical protein VFS21_22570 [Roseiflexaceae bacterium]|nr:hypothetical protein [Roseiflexaceae bacterium]